MKNRLLFVSRFICSFFFFSGDPDYYDPPDEDQEYEALIQALDEAGLSLDDPALEDLDAGDLWSLLEEAAAHKARP